MNNIFETINDHIEGAEGSIITLVTTLVPWLAPILPAYMTGFHLIEMLKTPLWVAIPMALSVEFLGLAAISTAFSAMRHNKKKDNRAKANKVELAFPVVAYVFYLLIVLVVNVVLEIPMEPQNHQYAQIAAIALLTLISAPAFVIAVSRQEQREISGQMPMLRNAAHHAENAAHKSYACGKCEFTTEKSAEFAAHSRWAHRDDDKKNDVG